MSGIHTGEWADHVHEWERGAHMAQAFGLDGRRFACAICGVYRPPRVRLTGTGALAAAFSTVVSQSEQPGAWWRASALLTATGIAHHLDLLGYRVVRKPVARA
jgi:hypothetical protein